MCIECWLGKDYQHVPVVEIGIGAGAALLLGVLGYAAVKSKPSRKNAFHGAQHALGPYGARGHGQVFEPDVRQLVVEGLVHPEPGRAANIEDIADAVSAYTGLWPDEAEAQVRHVLTKTPLAKYVRVYPGGDIDFNPRELKHLVVAARNRARDTNEDADWQRGDDDYDPAPKPGCDCWLCSSAGDD